MKHAALSLIFIAGLRISINDWKQTIKSYRQYREVLKRGFHPSDYLMGCSCGNCTPEELEDNKKDIYRNNINDLAKGVSIYLHQSIFHSGISLIVLYIIIQLTINK